MSENRILEIFLTSLFKSQSEMCIALGLSTKAQPRFSQAFKGEKHSLSLVLRKCEEKQVLSREFLQEIAQICEKSEKEIIILQKKVIEKQEEVHRINLLFQEYLSKMNHHDKHQPEGVTSY